jgi:hypothetical protein
MMLQNIQHQIKEFFREDKPFSIEDELAAIRQRNEARVKAAIEELGEKWIGHPKHSVQRMESK